MQTAVTVNVLQLLPHFTLSLFELIIIDDCLENFLLQYSFLDNEAIIVMISC